MDEWIRIQYSATGFGFGAFTTVPIPKGTVVGMYLGRDPDEAKKDPKYTNDYVFHLKETGVDAFDGCGMFETTLGFMSEDHLRKLPSEEVHSLSAVWHGSCYKGKQRSNWTRFINHARIELENLLAHKKETPDPFQSIEFIANHAIPAGAELFFDYGRYYFVDYDPVDPHIDESRPYCVARTFKRRPFFVDRDICFLAEAEAATLATSCENKKSSSAQRTAR